MREQRCVLDTDEVSVASYTDCVAQGLCSMEGVTERWRCNWGSLAKHAHPMNCVTYAQAAQYCRARGARLPTEQEWRTMLTYRSPDDLDAGCTTATLNPDYPGTCPGGTAEWPGARHRDVIGNVSEWVASETDAGPPRAMGFNWGVSLMPPTLATRLESFPVAYETDGIHGFRCIRCDDRRD